MNRLIAGLLLLLGLASPALAQRVTNPIPNAGVYGAYNASPPTCVTGSGCWFQTDINGNLKVALSGGGGGGPATIADGADVAEGATTDAASSAGGTGTVSAKLRLMTTQLGTINTTLGTPAQAGATINTQGAVNVTLTDCSGTITSGGAAQNAFTAAATRHGFTIANIDTTEVLWISFTTTAAASGTGSYPLGPADATTFSSLSSFTSPVGMGINTALSVIGATTAHKFTCTVW